MLVIAIISGLISLAALITWLVRSKMSEISKGGVLFGALFWVLGIVWFFSFVFALHFSPSTNNLTGYIYSANTTFGYTEGHIRFSEQAGQDVQPSFCVKADSEAGRQIKELAGSGKKVKVTIPPYFYFANNPYACGTTKMKIEAL